MTCKQLKVENSTESLNNWSTIVRKRIFYLQLSSHFRRRKSTQSPVKFTNTTWHLATKNLKFVDWFPMRYQPYVPRIRLFNNFSSLLWFVWTVMLSIMVICCHWQRKLLSCCFHKVWLKYCLLRKLLPWVSTCLQRLLYSTLLKRLQDQMVGWDFWTLHNMCRCQVVLVVVVWIKKEP